MTRSRLTLAVAVVLLTVTVSGCGAASSLTATTSPAAGQTAGPSTHATSPGSSTAPPSTPRPVVTESNPPGDIPDNQAYVAFASPSHRYVVNVPEGWARSASGSSATFTDKLNSITVVESVSGTAPTVGTVTAVDVQALRAVVPQFALGKVVAFTRDGGSGVLITYLADSTPDPVTNKVVRDAVEEYVFWKAGHRVVLRLTGAQNADNVDPWAKVTGSFRWTM